MTKADYNINDFKVLDNSLIFWLSNYKMLIANYCMAYSETQLHSDKLELPQKYTLLGQS